MAKKSTGKVTASAPTFAVGDRVEILHLGSGRVTELRGPLGPGGAQVYRVRYRRKPTPGYMEVLGNQLRLVMAKEHAGPAGDEPAATPS